MKRFTFLFFISFFLFIVMSPFTGFSQVNVDSLFAEINTLENDSLRVIGLNKLVFKYNRIQVNIAGQLSDTAISYSKIIASDYLLALSFMNRGLNEQARGNLTNSISYYDSALVIAIKMDNERALASIYNNIGELYKTKGKLDLALYNYQKSLEYTHDSIREATRVCNIALVYYSQAKFEEAISIYIKSNCILEKAGQKRYLINNYSALAALYLETRQYSRGIEFAKKALALSIETNDLTGQSKAWLGLGRIFIHKGEFNEGLLSLKKSLDISEKTENSLDLMYINNSLTEAFNKSGNYDSSIYYAKQTVIIATKLDAKQTLNESYFFLSDGFMKMGNYKEAYEYLKLKNLVNDAINKEESQKRINELQTKYETKEKEKEIITLKAEKELQLARSKNKTYLIALLALIIMVIGILTLFYQKNQKNKFHRKLLEEREKEAEAQKRRFAKELHDGTGSNLTGIRLQLLSLKDKTGDSNKIKQLINEVERTHQGIRLLAYQALPPEFGKYTLDGAISDLVRRLSKTGSVKINYSSIMTLDWSQTSQELQLALYRIVQEALSNIFKHAFAQNINIQIIQHETSLNIMIEDDGKGFDPKTANKGIGLSNIKERAEGLGGHLEIDSTVGNGCTVIINVPLPKKLHDEG